MGHSDPKQKKLTFNADRTPRQWRTSSYTEDPLPGHNLSVDGISPIMVELRAGFESIHKRFDTLNSRLHHVSEGLDTRTKRLDGAERKISEVE
ncbi:hypothetical protein NDU88_004385 [Pleurodeles waltl]|uniref:t-SNARE coiled-coil homology domain-containing protein n=1 Tax=Pleurodeles waltl TaxID=8319 RepID=A0AAV7SIM8_PLEWA|nr:hypothetical protein NDU88_004385 [Pleurodeles waltl]